MKLQVGGTSWSHPLRKYLAPYATQSWKLIHASAPDINHPFLVFPWYILSKSGNRWALLIRIRVIRRPSSAKAPWTFVILNPSQDTGTAAMIKRLMTRNTTFALPDGKLNYDIPSRQNEEHN